MVLDIPLVSFASPWFLLVERKAASGAVPVDFLVTAHLRMRNLFHRSPTRPSLTVNIVRPVQAELESETLFK